jgi:hypothetical protein
LQDRIREFNRIHEILRDGETQTDFNWYQFESLERREAEIENARIMLEVRAKEISEMILINEANNGVGISN